MVDRSRVELAQIERAVPVLARIWRLPADEVAGTMAGPHGWPILADDDVIVCRDPEQGRAQWARIRGQDAL